VSKLTIEIDGEDFDDLKDALDKVFDIAVSVKNIEEAVNEIKNRLPKYE
jgi:hypothetical protein